MNNHLREIANNNKPCVIIEVNQGVLTEIHSNHLDIPVYLIDWDNIKEGDYEIFKQYVSNLDSKTINKYLDEIDSIADYFPPKGT